MAKFCPNCGNGLAEAARFCPGCGTQIPAAPQQQAPPPYIQPQPYPPAPQPPPVKKKRTGLFIALGAAALVVLAIVLIAVWSRGDGPGPAPITHTTTTAAETQPLASPLVGLWRNEYEDGVELLSFEGDGTFSGAIHFFGSGGQINREFGSYRMEGNQLVLYDITDDEGSRCDDISFACNLSGDTLALDDAGTYDRVAAQDVATVLDNPFTAYPPGGGGAATQPAQPYVTTRPTMATKPPSRGIVGYWRHYYRTLYTGSLGAMTYMNKYVNYSFYDDGTFKYTSLIVHPLVVEGNYSVLGGKIHFTILNTYLIRNNDTRDIEEKRPVNNSFSAKYELGADENGEYLIIGVVDFLQNTTFDDFSTENAEKEKSRRQTIDYAALHPLDELNYKEPVVMP